MAEARYLLKDAKSDDVIRAVNTTIGILRGNVPGHWFLFADDGEQRDIRGGATLATGLYALKIQSAAGDHLLIRDSVDAVDVFSVTDTVIQVRPSTFEFLLSGQRIVGDMGNATRSNRVAFQSNVGTSSFLGILPPSGQTTSGFNAFNNAAPDSASLGAVMQATATAMDLRAESPSGSYLPMAFYTNATKQLEIATSGVATFTAAPVVPNTNPPTVNGSVTSGSQMKAAARIVGATGALGTNYNIASVTRNAAGDYTVTWDHDFVNATYGVQVTVHDNAAVLIPRVNGQATGSCDVHVRDVAGVLTDPVAFSILAFGTLA